MGTGLVRVHGGRSPYGGRGGGGFKGWGDKNVFVAFEAQRGNQEEDDNNQQKTKLSTKGLANLSVKGQVVTVWGSVVKRQKSRLLCRSLWNPSLLVYFKI